MAQSKVTLNELITAVRELAFDRFIIPAFAIKQMGENFYVDIEKGFTPEDAPEGYVKGLLSIHKVAPTSKVVEIPFNGYPTLEDVMNKLIEEGITVAYTPYFRGAEPTSALIQVKKRELSEDFTAFRRYFFSDEEIKEMICWYYARVLNIQNVELTEDVVSRLVRPSERHLTIWVAYQLVDKRRLYENAAKAIGQSFTDGSDYTGSSDTTTGTVTTVQIGSVFNVTEDPTTGHFYEDFNRVGSDNTWGDRFSFWYRLMLYLRDLLETQFGDFSLRKDNVIPGYISLQRELDFRSYYDSYPFTLSPLSRGILSKTP